MTAPDQLLNEAKIIKLVESRKKSEDYILNKISEHIKLLTDTATCLIRDPDSFTADCRAKLIKYLAIADKYKFMNQTEMDFELYGNTIPK